MPVFFYAHFEGGGAYECAQIKLIQRGNRRQNGSQYKKNRKSIRKEPSESQKKGGVYLSTTIIAVDHGYGNIKTVHEIFPSGIIPCADEPTFAQDKLYWAGHWYVIGEGHKEFTDDKAGDEDYLLLTMVAIAKELKLLGKTEAEVHLAVGLPLTWVGEQKDKFRTYFLRIPVLDYNYNGIDYHVELTDVSVYAQGFAYAITCIRDFTGTNMLCDIGNGTMSSMFINDCRPVSGKMFMDKLGTYQCVLAIQEALMKTCHLSVEESIIEQALRCETAHLSPRVLEVINSTASEYAETIMRRLREHGYNPELVKLHLMGGGACIIRNFGKMDSGNVSFNMDIHATAKGYQYLAEQELRTGGVSIEKG